MGDVLRNKNPRDGKKGNGGQADAKVETRNRQGCPTSRTQARGKEGVVSLT